MVRKPETTLEQPARFMFADQLFYFFLLLAFASVVALPIRFIPHIIGISVVGYWITRVRGLLSSSLGVATLQPLFNPCTKATCA